MTDDPRRPKRRRGEGSLRKSTKGTGYEGRYTDADGFPKTVRGKTEDEARRRLTAALTARDTGGVTPGRQSTERFLTEWMTVYVNGNDKVRPTTRKTYDVAVRKWLIPNLGKVPVADLRPVHLTRLHDTMRESGKRPATIRAAHRVLSSALAAGVRSGDLVRNVATLVSPPSTDIRTVNGEPIVPPSVLDLGLILEYLRGDDLEPLYRLAIATGLRQGEALALRWRDLTLDENLTGRRNVVRITGTRDRTGKIVGPTKSKAGNRAVRLSPKLASIFEDHRRRMESYGRGVEDDDFVFTGPAGRPLLAETVRRHLYRTQQATGVRRFRWHDFRHGYVTRRLGAGHDVVKVSRSVGHAEVRTTTNIYDHVDPVDLDPLPEIDEVPTPILRVLDAG